MLELNPNGKRKIHREQLLKRGFDFDFHTSTYVTKAGDTYYFCYEHGYLQLDDGFILMVERKETD